MRGELAPLKDRLYRPLTFDSCMFRFYYCKSLFISASYPFIHLFPHFPGMDSVYEVFVQHKESFGTWASNTHANPTGGDHGNFPTEQGIQRGTHPETAAQIRRGPA